MRRFEIDYNQRTTENRTPAPYHGTPPEVGQRVIAACTEDGTHTYAQVVSVDTERHLAYLEVDWGSLAEDGFEWSWLSVLAVIVGIALVTLTVALLIGPR